MVRAPGRRARSRSVLACALGTVVVASSLTACGSSGGPPTLNWFINPDNGAQTTLAKECTAAADGRYKITTTILPSDASEQRQQLVTRLSAKDSSIDIMSLDPVFVPEFAEAGFLADVPTQYRQSFTADIVKPAVQASTWQDQLVAAPFWANTQLLWYRKSLAAKAGLDMSKPVTWDQIIKAAQSQHRTVGVQANLYEGYTVWINSLIAGAGGKILDNPGALAKNIKLGIDSDAGRDAARVIRELADDHVGGPALSTNEEAQSLSLFEGGSTGMFLTNWPYTWAQMASDNVSFRDSDVGWTFYPETVAGTQSAPPFGGIELAVSAYGNNRGDAFDAVNCLRDEQHQREYMILSGNPAANTRVYSDTTPLVSAVDGKQTSQTVQSLFPMASLIEQSLDRAAPRPQTQYYGDLSTAIQESFSPPDSVDQLTPARAQSFALQVLKGERLL